jgi:hypothetical protein
VHLAALHALIQFGAGQFDHRQFGLEWRLQFVAAQVAVDRFGRTVTTGDRLDDESRAGNRVARGEDARPGGSQGVGVDGDGGLAGDAHATAVGDEGQTGTLADGEDDHIAGDDMLRARSRLQRQPAISSKAI